MDGVGATGAVGTPAGTGSIDDGFTHVPGDVGVEADGKSPTMQAFEFLSGELAGLKEKFASHLSATATAAGRQAMKLPRRAQLGILTAGVAVVFTANVITDLAKGAFGVLYNLAFGKEEELDSSRVSIQPQNPTTAKTNDELIRERMNGA